MVKGELTIFYLNSQTADNKKLSLKPIIQVILGIVILALSWLLYSSIIQPIRFNREVEIRVSDAIERLVAIRKAQTAFKDVRGDYTASFDTLIDFILNDSFQIERKTGSYIPDEMTENEAVEQGLVEISTTLVSVKDSLFAPETDVEMIRYIPYTDQEQFNLNAGFVSTASRVQVDVFEVYVLYDSLFSGLNEQLVENYKAERERITGFPGLKIGSMNEATNHSGNWE